MRTIKLHYAWIILAAVILIRGFAGGGINMTSGLFLSPVSKDIGVGIGSLSIYLSITSIVMVFWLPYAGRLINKYDIRIMAVAGAVLQALSFAGFGFMNTVYGWYLLAIPHAMGATILVNLLGPILINRWFSKNAGTMLGIQMAFVSLFGAVLQPVTSNIITQYGWRTGYFFIGGITFAVVLLTAFILLKNRPEEKHLLPFGADTETAGKNFNFAPKGQLAVPEKTALHSASFYLLLFFMIAITGIGVFTQHIPTYGTLLGYSVKRTGAALAYASIGSAIGSIAIGIISDKIGSLKTCYGMIGIGITAVAGFLISGQNFTVFAVSTFLHGLVSSGIMVLAPILTLKFYGQNDYEKIFAKISMGAPIASIVLVPAYGFIYDITESYRAVLIGMICLLAFAAFCITVGWKKRCTREGCPSWRKTS
ncbi:MFS transporter [Anaerostipes sp.]|uniref:MFS transporter n=1 Tax=Anaerostipes sp. TaxID=1872530 RepID=UPI0025B7CECB|nr:MFS transporter [Anaerostipes sp.]MBS7007520.1 MFS transporter [Anaerostipes sp.]